MCQPQYPLVMGILNITPDSFYDGDKYFREKDWLKHCEEMVEQGADIIDIGAVSTRPGSNAPSFNEELDRLSPVLKSIRRLFPDIIISIDTYRSEIVRFASDNGADLINDISAGTMDKNMFRTVASLNIPYMIMHIRGTPADMQHNPQYSEHPLKVIMQFFSEKINLLKKAGLSDIIIDPGFGFGKSVEHNFQILTNLQMLDIFELPVAVGLSRKSMINKTLNINPDEALNGTTVLNTIALLKNVDILRVHDVKPAVEAIKLIKQLA